MNDLRTPGWGFVASCIPKISRDLPRCSDGRQMWRYVTPVQGSDASNLGCLSLVTWNLLVNFGHLLVNRLGTQQYPTNQTVYAIKDEQFLQLLTWHVPAPKLKRSHFSDSWFESMMRLQDQKLIFQIHCWDFHVAQQVMPCESSSQGVLKDGISRSTGGNVDTGGSGKHPQTFPNCWSIDFKYWARR